MIRSSLHIRKSVARASAGIQSGLNNRFSVAGRRCSTYSANSKAAAAAAGGEKEAQSAESSATSRMAHQEQQQQQEHKHTNRLAQEQSPYLLQHAHNPVDWWPWCDEAIKAAREQDKPIFLSVGYATCHWCHVMEGESFESEETAAIMNAYFINIKVDREERPDVDRVYMAFVQATTGGGGWPMSVWLTPDLKPFYGGTYYPGKDRYGMPSFSTVLRRIAQLWGTKREELQEQGDTVMQQLQEITAPASPTAADADADGFTHTAAELLSPQALSDAVSDCAASLAKGFDKERGGFGPAPKFPRPSEINLLLRAATSKGASSVEAQQLPSAAGAHIPPPPSQLLRMSLFSLQAMAAGGMYDQLGGGFHRYSVDEFWHVPHFEKMLYDNPQLALTYLDAFRITLAKQRSSSSSGSGGSASNGGSSAAAAAATAAASESKSESGVSTPDDVLFDSRVYAATVRGVLDYLRRDMTHPEGGLYSAEDADSLNPATNKKSEGAFYVWSYEEIQAVLGPQRAPLFCEVYGVQPGGNCDLSPRSDPHNEFTNLNVLAQFKRLSEVSAAAGAGSMTPAQAGEMLGGCRRELFEARAQRPRPSLDDKIVTAWNGQGISAFALASRILPAEQPPAAPCFPVEGCDPQTYLQAAVSIASFVRGHLYDPTTKRLKRSYCKAPSSVEGFADDYALLISGLLDLFEAGGGLTWLTWAVELQDTLDSLFWDSQGYAYFQTSGADPSVLLRLKEDYDGAEPAASSVAAINLMRLAALLPNGAASSSSASGSSSSSSSTMSYAERADAVLSAFSSRLQRVGLAMPQMCVAAWLKTRTPLRQVIVSGPAAHPATQSLLDAAHAAWAPDKALILIDPTDPDSVRFWKAQNPEAWNMVESHYNKLRSGPQQGGGAAAAAPEGVDVGGEMSGAAAAAGGATAAAGGGGGVDDGGFPPTAFVCQNFTCQAPSSDPARVYELLSKQQGGAGGGGGAAAVKLQPFKL